jgi:hypothetical protein
MKRRNAAPAVTCLLFIYHLAIAKYIQLSLVMIEMMSFVAIHEMMSFVAIHDMHE